MIYHIRMENEMAESNDTHRRIDELECKYLFQQEALETLNGEVTKQWQVIDKLTQQMKRLMTQVQDMEAGYGSQSDGMPDMEPPPPHY